MKGGAKETKVEAKETIKDEVRVKEKIKDEREQKNNEG
jgi:hypothetical protein